MVRFTFLKDHLAIHIKNDLETKKKLELIKGNYYNRWIGNCGMVETMKKIQKIS